MKEYGSEIGSLVRSVERETCSSQLGMQVKSQFVIVRPRVGCWRDTPGDLGQNL